MGRITLVHCMPKSVISSYYVAPNNRSYLNIDAKTVSEPITALKSSNLSSHDIVWSMDLYKALPASKIWTVLSGSKCFSTSWTFLTHQNKVLVSLSVLHIIYYTNWMYFIIYSGILVFLGAFQLAFEEMYFWSDIYQEENA